MRHHYTNRAVVVMGVLFLVLSAVFALAALRGGPSERVEQILALEDHDLDAGRSLYLDALGSPCADCHGLAEAGASSDRASDLDQLRPTRRETVVSIVGGHIGAHESRGYRVELSDRQIADLAAYIEANAGR